MQENDDGQDDSSTIYEQLGGEAVLRKLTQRFYETMNTVEDFKELRAMHPKNIQSSEEKLFMFLSGWLGGPNLFMEKYGHPRLRARHMPFKIDKKARNQWMMCMVQAFDDVKVGEPLRTELLHSLLNLADHMRNVQEAT